MTINKEVKSYACATVFLAAFTLALMGYLTNTTAWFIMLLFWGGMLSPMLKLEE